MSKFFISFRKKTIDRNAVKKYLFYAVGEIALVVIGILKAIQVNVCSEQNKIEGDRRELIETISKEWVDTSERLGIAQKRYDSLEYQMVSFLHKAYLSEDTANVDTLQHLIGHFFRYYNFNPNLTTYNEAQSSGKLSIIRSKELSLLFTEFFEKKKDFDNHIRICSDYYFLGGIEKLRMKAGFISFYEDHEFYKRLTGNKPSKYEYIAFLSDPEVSGILESQFDLIDNIKKILKKMGRTVDNISLQLEQLNNS